MVKLKKSFVHVYTGNGKGKTTAALGLAVRALGAGLSVCLIQFLKGYTPYNELKALKKFGKKIKIIKFEQVHPMFCSSPKSLPMQKALQESIKDDFRKAVKVILGRKYDVVILDEIINAASQDFIPENELIKLMEKKPKNTELVLTGRNASERLKKKADYVTEMRLVKHPYYKGQKARRGIEY